VAEVETLRSKKNEWSSAVFAGIKAEDIRAGVQRIAAIPDDTIRALVGDFGPGGKKARAKLADRLIARKNDLIGRFLKK
jgi:hypothetical protein